MAAIYDYQTDAGYGPRWIAETPEDQTIDAVMDEYVPTPAGDTRSVWERMGEYGFTTAMDTIGQIAVERARMRGPAYQIGTTDGTVTPQIRANVKQGAVSASAQIPTLWLIVGAAAAYYFLIKR